MSAEPSRPAGKDPAPPPVGGDAAPAPTPDHAPASAPHDPYAALRFAPYRRFSVGWMLAVIGQTMTATAVGWEIYQRTGSKLALGYVGGVQAIPLIFLALPGGILADRFDRRRILTMACVGAAICSLCLAVISWLHAPVQWIYLTLLAGSSCLTLGRPSRSAILPHLLPLVHYPNAVTWNATIFQTSAMIGPALGGLVLSVNVRWVYLLDAVCSLAYAAITLTLPPMRAHMTAGREPALHMLAQGLAFIRRQTLILATITLDLFAVLLGGVVYLLPVFAKDILHVSAVGFGWLRAAEALGALGMAVLIAHLPPMRRAGRSLLWAVTIFGICTIIFGLSRSFWLSFAMLLIIGAADTISVLVRHTLVQLLTPDAMRGRVNAVNNIFIGASNELGGLESGVTAHWLGPVGSAIFGGVGTIVTVLVVNGIWPQVRRIGALNELAPAVPAQPLAPEGTREPDAAEVPANRA